MSDALPNESTKHADATSDAENIIREIPMPTMIGRYRVSGVIGKGGFGTVFLATDESLDRQVAIKVQRRLPTDPTDASQWNAEARMVAMLDHPNIVPVFDVGSCEEFPFFVVSKFIEGVDLRGRLHREKPPVSLAIAWITDVAAALQHSHEKGLVHRDVKPSNILIDTKDRPWLTDFGLALCDNDIGREAGRRMLIGTISYMSPEQARGEGHLVDGRADIFALGIVMYELLLGKRPFTGGSSEQLLRNIVRAEPRPLRQTDPTIAVELERICMKALAQRLSDRYDNCHDMAEDLRRYSSSILGLEGVSHDPDHRDRDDAARNAVLGVNTATARNAAYDPKVIPKGLRAFDEHDQSFFLRLVPGTRDANGVPDILRRLRMRITSRKLDDSFRVGLLYGSSGSGKSSLVRAGLIPLLDDSVHVAYVESDATQTEMRILAAIAPLAESPSIAESSFGFVSMRSELSGTANVDDDRPGQSLIDAMTAIRRGAAAEGRKVVIVLDQFEQWLHSHPIVENTDLVNALRQCDGVNLQCLVLIRDDFWMPATRFFHELDIRLIQGVNCTAVDQFELRHARFVLTEFGRAYGCLPDDPSQITDEQSQFINAIVDSVQEDGKVISIHLVVLAQMLKGRPWNLKTLSELGGTEGVDLNFLDATFNDSGASPHHRSLQVPARAVLAELLPQMDTNIKGQMKDVSRLREVSNLNERDFQDLLAALDGELRMITPTVASDGDDASSRHCYQLTHDFLVPPLREWLTRSERQTPRGRAKLRLRELTEYWRRKRESRFLPSGFEYLRILALTNRADRNAEEAELLAAATRHHGARWAIAATLALLVGTAAYWTSQRVRANLAEQETQLGVDKLLASDTNHVLGAIESLRPVRDQVQPTLVEVIDDPSRSQEEVLTARLMLIESDAGQVKPLVQSALDGSADQISVICERLKLRSSEANELLWSIVDGESVDQSQWLRAAYALAQLDPSNAKWQDHAPRLARTVVDQSTPKVVEFASGFAKLAPFIADPMQAYFGNSDAASQLQHRDDARLNAAIVLSKCLRASDPALADLLGTAASDQFELLVSVAQKDSPQVVARLRDELTRVAAPQWSSLPSIAIPLDDQLNQAIHAASGFATDAFVVTQQVLLADFDDFAAQLNAFGFRPSCVRSYRSNGQTFLTAIWVRDGLAWEFTRHSEPSEVAETEQRMRAKRLYPTDITVIRSNDFDDEKTQYGILWAEAMESMIDARVYVGLTDKDHESKGWGPLRAGGYVPKSNLKRRHGDGVDRYSSVRWRTVMQPQCEDIWNDSQYDYESRSLEGWHQSDVRLNPPGEFDEQTISYSAVWWNGGAMESRTLTQVTLDEHLIKATKLADEGFRPVSISIVEENRVPVVASVWHRPFVTDDAKDELASRQANAVIAMFRLGAPEYLWPMLESTPDPRLRSYLINRLPSLGADPQILFKQLLVDPNPSRRFAIIASLAKYRPDQLPADVTSQARTLIGQWGVDDPRASIHAICGYLSRQWGWPETVEQIENAKGSALATQESPGWSMNSQGQTMVSIVGPAEFTMGSPGHEAFRDHPLEVSVRTRIPRSFAIGAAEITVGDFQQFDAATLYATEYTPSVNCPITSVSWYDAVRYCRWLSEQEGVDEKQMCYPSLDKIIEASETIATIPLPDDYLSRTGYRLPTEAEWEYACRALTTTSRPYGNAVELLSDYAWTTERATVDSRVRFHPVKQRLPNDFGLFDTLGNVMEWCDSPQLYHGTNVKLMIDNRTESNSIGYDRGILRGSAVFYIPTTMRSAKREETRLNDHHPYLGFRIARTLATHAD